MSSASSSAPKLEIGHVLFVDIVAYSKLLITEQSEQMQKLREIVRGTEQFRIAEAEGKLLRLPTGDGGALVFRTSPDSPVLCAVEISEALKSHPELRVRMGIHSGPVNEITDLNEQANIAGAGINIAQRVMDCGDAGHILLSKHVADDLEQYPQWRSHLHDLGECEVKHGVRVHAVNLYTDEVGNSEVPKKFKIAEAATVSAAPVRRAPPSRPWTAALTILVTIAAAAGFYIFSHRLGSNAIQDKSIAVLPFENLSEDKANAYFVEGTQDEILTRLSKIAALKVISRTSTEKYKSAPDNLSEVGKQLGVTNLLEGSVQKIANVVHINVQLIRAASGEHIWAESYNRKLDDVFGVEGEVASTIADQLNAKLTGAEQKALAEKPTNNLTAYDAYLRGLSIGHRSYAYDGDVQAATEYARAVELDSKFALAWARLATTRSYLYFNSIDTKTNSPAAIKEAADKAMSLQPDLAEAWVAEGAYRYRVRRDFAGALQAYAEARKRLPNSALVYEHMAFVERRLGRWADAEPHYKKATGLDPRHVSLLVTEGGEFYAYLRRFDDAQAALDRALEISPGEVGALAYKAGVFQRQGRLEEAAATLARIPTESTDDIVVPTRVVQQIYERHFSAAIDEVERKLNSVPGGKAFDSITLGVLVQMGFCQEWMGQHDKALSTFTRVVQAIKPTPDTIVSPEGNELPSTLALAYAGLDEKDKALAQAKEAVADYDTDAVSKPTAEVVLAQIQARFGDSDSAIAAIPHLLEVPAGITRADLKFNPLWDPLRNDPRFQKLAEQPLSQNSK
jgi:TolB-like protein/class 3 adenylate cyclase/Tfp pilus assembly protein PilF